MPLATWSPRSSRPSQITSCAPAVCGPSTRVQHQLAPHVEDPQGDVLRARQGEADGGAGVEGVGVVLVEDHRGRQHVVDAGGDVEGHVAVGRVDGLVLRAVEDDDAEAARRGPGWPAKWSFQTKV